MGKGYFTGRKFSIEGASTLFIKKGCYYKIGNLVKKELLVINSEFVYNIHDSYGNIVDKVTHLMIQERFKNGSYNIVW